MVYDTNEINSGFAGHGTDDRASSGMLNVACRVFQFLLSVTEFQKRRVLLGLTGHVG